MRQFLKYNFFSSDPYADPYYDYEMEALWRGGQYENFRVQYTEAPLPYHYGVSIVHTLLKYCHSA